MSKIPSVKGTRDLYPEVLSPIRRIFDIWRDVSIRHGFLEWEGPTLELLDLYREKSGEELVGQLFRLTDAGGRELALRPEMTPSLARMVAAKINALPKPIKWFCISNLFRGENVQRGRLREFYQWNVDVIGSAELSADAEVILAGVEALRELGLTAQDFAVHISNRRLIRAVFLAVGIDESAHPGAYASLDKVSKLPANEFARRWGEAYGEKLKPEALSEILQAGDLETVRRAVGVKGAATDDELNAAVNETQALLTLLQNFGILEFCKIDLGVVRGLAYYTGPVFEFYDRSLEERAICGGGRYDNLLGKLGKSNEPAVGFGMGDVVLSLLLEEKGLLKPTRGRTGVFVADAAENVRDIVFRVVGGLRRAGLRTEFSHSAQPIGKGLKTADKWGARQVVLVGDEARSQGMVKIKDMAGGEEREAAIDELLREPGRFLENKP